MSIELVINGEDVADLKTTYLRVGKEIWGFDFDPAEGGPMANGHDAVPPPAEDAASQPTRRRRARDAAATPAAPAETAPAKNPDQLRTEAVDILKTCFGMPDGAAEKVIALQKQFDVKRFAEVSDARVAELYKAAVDLQAELTGGAAPAPAADSGPFWITPFVQEYPF